MGPVEDLEIQRRSLAMLAPGQMALNREAAITLLQELQEAQRRIVELEREIHEAAARRHPAAGGGRDL